jgi:bacterioferritin (cytochrome b1)
MSAANAEIIKRASTRIEISHDEREREMRILEAILKKEEGHGQWVKHGLCLITLVA